MKKTPNEKYITRKRAAVLIVLSILLILTNGCATPLRSMPRGKIDDPLILPKKLYCYEGGPVAMADTVSGFDQYPMTWLGRLVLSESSSFDLVISELLDFQLILGLGENDYALTGETREGKIYTALVLGLNPLASLAFSAAKTSDPYRADPNSSQFFWVLQGGTEHKMKKDNRFYTASAVPYFIIDDGKLSSITAPLFVDVGFQLTPRFSLETGAAIAWIQNLGTYETSELFWGWGNTLTYSVSENLRLELYSVWIPGFQDYSMNSEDQVLNDILKENFIIARVKVQCFF